MLDFIDSDSDSEGEGEGQSALQGSEVCGKVLQAVARHRKNRGGNLALLYVQSSRMHPEGVDAPKKTLSAEELFVSKLQSLGYLTLTKSKASQIRQEDVMLSPEPHYDILLDISVVFGADEESISSTNTIDWRVWHALLVPGGLFCCSAYSSHASAQVTSTARLWSSVVIDNSSSSLWHGTLQKAAVCCNSNAALYWVDENSDGIERDILENITITPTIEQRKHLQLQHMFPLQAQHSTASALSSQAEERAIHALREHGVCILRGFFSPKIVSAWGDAALQDFDVAHNQLKKCHDIDLYRPKEGQVINNFHELSMREALRVDLRNGKAVRAMIKEADSNEKCTTEEKSGDTVNNNLFSLGNHPIVGSIVAAAMLEEFPGPYADGNWGLWNFGGKGPLGPPPSLKVGDPGAVISLGGCTDQTVHSDTAHPFTCCDKLPAHYINLFLIAPDKAAEEAMSLSKGLLPEESKMGRPCLCCDFRVGQTAFIAGSHRLQVSSQCMNGGDVGEQELMRRLLRPHLQPGDALLFDCRALHFGLANTSGTKLGVSESEEQKCHAARGLVRRTLLYINYHQRWFSDPKNWNDKEKLFA